MENYDDASGNFLLLGLLLGCSDLYHHDYFALSCCTLGAKFSVPPIDRIIEGKITI